MHYHCSKQHKNIDKLQCVEQNIVIFFCRCLCLLQLVFPSPFSTADVFQFLDAVLCKFWDVTSDHSCRCMKNFVHNNFNLHLFLFSINRKSIQIYLKLKFKHKLSHKFFCVNSFKVKLEFLRNSSAIFRSRHRGYSIQKAVL